MSILLAAFSLNAGSTAADNINLSGSSGSPNQSNDFRTTDPSGLPTAVAGWIFQTDGSVDEYINGTQTEFNPTPDEWYDPNGAPVGTYYMRLTLDSGTAANNVSPAVGTWGTLASQRYCYHTQSVPAFDTFVQNGTYKVEISTTESDVGIVATGYYKYNIAVGP